MEAEILSQTDNDPDISTDRIRVTARRVACNGGGGALGHPQVWLNLGEDGAVMCPYCSREFVLDGAGTDGGHG